jgi:signal transduction histidine kinase
LNVQASFGLPNDFPDTLPFEAGDPLLGALRPAVTTGPLRAALPERNRLAPPRVERVDDQLRITALNTPNVAGEQMEVGEAHYQAGLTVPLLIKEEIYGSLILYYREPRSFTSEEMELAATVGDQTALAIENARLRTQVERTAVAAERSRIARDLHDSVTQTLFSAALIAEVLPRLWQRDVQESERRLEELRQLTRGALAEMRTLLLELRPATLEEVDIGELLRQLAEAFTGRARVPIRLELEGEGPLPPDVKIAFYHIGQEALNNVAKHGRASQTSVRLERGSGHARLTVTDDGQGFVIDSVTPEHLGLTIMHERAEAIGARLQIESRLQHGTTVVVEWSASPGASLVSASLPTQAFRIFRASDYNGDASQICCSLGASCLTGVSDPEVAIGEQPSPDPCDARRRPCRRPQRAVRLSPGL